MLRLQLFQRDEALGITWATGDGHGWSVHPLGDEIWGFNHIYWFMDGLWMVYGWLTDIARVYGWFIW